MFQALEIRLADLARGFEEATIDKNEQEEKTVKMKKMLDTAAQLRRVRRFRGLFLDSAYTKKAEGEAGCEALARNLLGSGLNSCRGKAQSSVTS